MLTAHRSRLIASWLLGPVVFLLLATACAKVGDPLPPLDYQPGGVTDLELVQVGERARLIFSLPRENVREIEVYRSCGGTGTVSAELRPIARLQSSQLAAAPQAGRYVFEDRPGAARSCSYALRITDGRGRESSLSAAVQTLSVVPAQPPTHVRRHEAGEDRIVIRWDPPVGNIDGSRPADVMGYLVNSKDFVADPEYVDRDFQFGQPRTYHVQAVTRKTDPLILSDFSDTLSLVPRDEFPPSAPANVTAVGLEGSITLLWDANRESDLKGYLVYRGNDPAELKRSSSLITINTYLDDSVSPGSTYYYQVSAIDEAGNESRPSELLAVTLSH